ncbi:expansin family protein, partial [Cyathus striatus]
LFASILITLASPIPITYGGELSEISKTKRLNHVGKATWFYPGLGSCGRTNTKSDFIVGIGKALYDENKGKNCGQYMEIVNTSNGKKTYAQVVDRCPGCGTNDLDMSPAVFEKLSSLDAGVIQVSWHFMNK